MEARSYILGVTGVDAGRGKAHGRRRSVLSLHALAPRTVHRSLNIVVPMLSDSTLVANLASSTFGNLLGDQGPKPAEIEKP